MKSSGWILMLLFVIIGPKANAIEAEPQVMDEMIVTGSRIPHLKSQTGISITVLGREEIQAIPARTVSELLDAVGGVDVRSRGAKGIQSDVSIRGSSFEQVLVLIDGINLSDAQTGHHNMDLVVNIADIERIEILKGPGARIYGQNAMAGVINIITRSFDYPGATGGLSIGSHDYYKIQGSASGKTGQLANRFSASRAATDGDMPDHPTDFQVNTLTYKGEISTASHFLEMGLGLIDKEFGAYKFYSDTYPNQREKTQTVVAHANDTFSLAHVDILAGLFWRQHKDEFNIRIGDSWYTNEHTGNSAGCQIHSRFRSQLGTSVIGGEFNVEDLESSNLGDHDRKRSGIFFEHEMALARRFHLAFGTSALKYTDWGWQHWPGANINVELSKGLHLFSSIGKSFRVPTYTELYYDTPANQGNPDLEPEKAWTYEAGMRHQAKGLRTQVSFFLRDAENIIDWTRALPTDPWQVRNIAEVRTRGCELEMDIYPGVFVDLLHQTAMKLSYTCIDVDKTTRGLESKYILDHLKHQAKAFITLNWLANLSQSLVIRYEKRLNNDAYTVVDTRLTTEAGNFTFFMDVRNLLDAYYISNGFAPDPGRWIYVGFSCKTPFVR